MDKLIKWLYAGDRVLHILFSIVITLFAYTVTQFFCSKWWSILLALGTGLIIGGFKELYDALAPNHSADIKDFVADCIGILIALIPLMII